MSRVVERLLPSAVDHLCFSDSLPPGTATTSATTAATARNGSSSGSVAGPLRESDEAALIGSYNRWRRCFAVWRTVIDCDALLLALLLHAGCLCAPHYGRLEAAAAAVKEEFAHATASISASPSSAAAAAGQATAAHMLHALAQRAPVDVWALNVLNFLHITEVFGVDDADAGDNDDEAAEEEAGDGGGGRRSPPRKRRRGGRSSRSAHDSSDAATAAGLPRRLPVDCSLSILADMLPPPFCNAAALGPAGAAAAAASTLLRSSADVGGRPGRRPQQPQPQHTYPHGGGPTKGSKRAKAHEQQPPSAGGSATATASSTPAPESPQSSLVPEEQRRLLCLSLVTLTHTDEPLVQQTASWLVDEWMNRLSAPAEAQAAERAQSLWALRNYWLSAAVKMAAFVDGAHTALLEENAHVQAVMARQSFTHDTAAELFNRSLPSIFCCLLQEEMADGSASGASAAAARLLMPPPVYLLPFHALGRGSRVSVWVPHTADDAATRGSGRRGAASKAPPAPPPDRLARGGFVLAEVASQGVCLGDAASATAPLSVDVQLLDDGEWGGHSTAHGSGAATINRLLPHCAAPVEGGGAAAAPPARRWSSAVRQLQGHLRIDSAAPRILLMRPIAARNVSRQSGAEATATTSAASATTTTTAATAATATTGAAASKRRRGGGAAHAQDTLLTLLSGVYPCAAADVLALLRDRLQTARVALSHQRGTAGVAGGGRRHTMARDALGATLHFLYLSARRVLALRGTAAVAAPPPPPPPNSGHGKGAGRGGRGKGAVRGAAAPPAATADALLLGLVEAAASLSIAALLLSHNLAEGLLEQQTTAVWLTEVAAFAAEVATVTTAPVPRLLRAAGLALCLLHPRPQSVLVAAGLYAALGAEQLRSLDRAMRQRQQQPTAARDGGGAAEVHLWWGAFRAAVLEDPRLPAQLHPTTWALTDSVDRSVRRVLEQRARGWCAASAGLGEALATTAGGDGLVLRLQRRTAPPTAAAAEDATAAATGKDAAKQRRRLPLRPSATPPASQEPQAQGKRGDAHSAPPPNTAAAAGTAEGTGGAAAKAARAAVLCGEAVVGEPPAATATAPPHCPAAALAARVAGAGAAAATAQRLRVTWSLLSRDAAANAAHNDAVAALWLATEEALRAFTYHHRGEK